MKYANLKSAAAGVTQQEAVLHKAESEYWDWRNARDQMRNGGIMAGGLPFGTRVAPKVTAGEVKLNLTEALARMALAKAEVTLARRELATFAARIAKGQ